MLKSFVCITMLHHERHKRCMVVVYMHYIWEYLPGIHPMNCCYLKCTKTLSVIIITINLFPVKQPIDVNQKQFKALCVGLFFDDGVIKPPMAKIGGRFVHHFPVMCIKVGCSVHGHENL